MDKERLKLIYKNMKSLVDALESEVYSDTDAYVHPRGEYKEKITYGDQIEEL
jgi:hypothetical protein|tara:strand:- start:753 stop:908 length:156 start_codon:yes stop_codon:yes gene_type:complete